jgi:DNA-binding NarL/FixJ family response regulator
VRGLLAPDPARTAAPGAEPLDADTLFAVRAQRARVDELTGAAASRWPALSRREREVVQLAALGLENPAIAEALRVTPNTAKTYIQRALERLGARNRAEVTLAYLAATGRLLPEPDPPAVPYPRRAGQPATRRRQAEATR